jgi:NADPH:quinone reductase-like Zn-dependent oxidoreductase
VNAYVLHRYGGPGAAAIADWPAPQIGAGDLLVRVAAVGLNPVDYKTRDGALKVISNPPRPFVMGNECAGEVIACGPAVRRFTVGDQVIARVAKDRMAAFAELVAIDESIAARAPARVPLTSAAALPLAGLTALQALRDELQVTAGTHLLITGGAGGVGTFAIQIAKHCGATVTTTASPRGTALVRSLGADQVIDYTTTPLRSVAQRFDAVFDTVGGESLRAAFGLAKAGATVLSVAGMPEPTTARKDLGRGIGLQLLFWVASFGLRRLAARHGVRYRYLFMHPDGQQLAELSVMVDAGVLTPVIDRTCPFAEMDDAIAYLEAGRAKGKVVVTLR